MRYKYLISSERAHRRSDEMDNVFYSNNNYSIGDSIQLDGLTWFIVDRCK